MAECVMKLIGIYRPKKDKMYFGGNVFDNDFEPAVFVKPSHRHGNTYIAEQTELGDFAQAVDIINVFAEFYFFVKSARLSMDFHFAKYAKSRRVGKKFSSRPHIQIHRTMQQFVDSPIA